ncbi:MAG: FAD-dependent oxidoreductase [Nanoarchaeota archaeon]
MISIFQSEVLHEEMVNDSVKLLKLSVPENFQHQAGQYVSLSIPFEGKKYRKPYSIASHPGKEKAVELCVKIIEGSHTTNYIHKLQKGDDVELFGPAGKFVLEKDYLEKDIVFVATGTGIAPFRSMIKHLLKNGFHKRIILLKGFRNENSSLYDGEFSELQDKHRNLEVYNILSRPENVGFEDKGYVQDFLKKYLPENFSGHVYICGLSPMINAVHDKLISMGILKERIFYEKYD